jgi:hypothetical protein
MEVEFSGNLPGFLGIFGIIVQEIIRAICNALWCHWLYAKKNKIWVRPTFVSSFSYFLRVKQSARQKKIRKTIFCFKRFSRSR